MPGDIQNVYDQFGQSMNNKSGGQLQNGFSAMEVPALLVSTFALAR